MRVAIISDIHGNCIGLEAVLADLRLHPVDQLVCLGDVVQGGPQPVESVKRLRELTCPVVMGNTDAWVLTGQETGKGETPSEQELAVREWSLAQLSGEDCTFIESFQPTVEIALDAGKRLLCFHGSPRSFDDVILPETSEEEVQRLLGEFEAFILAGGHTHTQQIRRLGDSFFFNPGSAGYAYDRRLPEADFWADPWAEYAILSSEDGRLGLEFHRVPFDVNELIRVILASGRPYAESAIAEYQRTRAAGH